MKLHTLSEFSKTVMRQTEQPVSYFFLELVGRLYLVDALPHCILLCGAD